MYQHIVKEGPMTTHLISTTDGASLIEVVPNRGGIISRLVLNNKNLFFIDESSLFDDSKAIRGGNPILFPICSYVKDDKYHVDGKAYTMKQHGFARNLPWEVLEVKVSEDSASMKLGVSNSDFTLVQYPFRFRLECEYLLKSGSLTITLTCINKDEKPLPFYAGFHPYFNVGNKELVEINIPSEDYMDFIEGSTKDGKLDYSLRETNTIYHPLSSNTCTIEDKSLGNVIKLKFDDIYKYIVVWSLKDRDFICVEPWMASRDAMNTEKDLVKVAPGERLDARFSISLGV